MPLFLIERQFAEEVDLSKGDVDEITRVNDLSDAHWLYSFLSSDKKKTYCLYEAPSAEAIRKAARELGLPVDNIVEVDRLQPDTIS